MSKYTTEVRFICESLTGYDESQGYDDIDSIIDDAIPLIFSFDFPIFDESYRNVLCTKILRHYYTREIGLETYGLWKLKLQTKLNEIMPYYNQLYKSELLKFNPLYDVDMTTVNTGSKTGESTTIGNSSNSRTRSDKNNLSEVDNAEDSRTNTSNGHSDVTSQNTSVEKGENSNQKIGTNRDLYSDTPQGALNGVESENYLTNARKITDNVTDTSSSQKDSVGVNTQTGSDTNTETTSGKNSRVNTKEANSSGTETNTGRDENIGRSKNTEDYVMQVMGKTGGVSYSKLLKDFRDTFLNIDMDVINDLGDLFMLLW